MDRQHRTLHQENSADRDISATVSQFLRDSGYRRHSLSGGAPGSGATAVNGFLIWRTPTTGSTNGDLAAAARLGDVNGLVLVADHQRAGRGRQQRTWLDRPGDGLLSSVYRLVATRDLELLPLAVGLAAVDAVNGLAPGPEPAAALKWPNDVLAPGLGNRKLAGILAESAPVPGSSDGHGVIIGMGMNVRWSTGPPSPVADRAVALTDVVDGDPSVDVVLTRYLAALANHLDGLGSGAVLDEYRQSCVTLGRRVRFETNDGIIEGRATDVDRSGALIVVDTLGRSHRLRSGDAHHI